MRSASLLSLALLLLSPSLAGCGGSDAEEEATEAPSSPTVEAARLESEAIRLRGELRQLREAKAQVEALRGFEAQLYRNREAIDGALRRCIGGEEVILAVTLRSDGASTMARPTVDALGALRGSGETELDEARAGCVRQALGREGLLGFWPVAPGTIELPERLRFEWPSHHVGDSPAAGWVEAEGER